MTTTSQARLGKLHLDRAFDKARGVDVKTIEVAPYYALLDPAGQERARKVLRHYFKLFIEHNEYDSDVVLERIWNALVGNK